MLNTVLLIGAIALAQTPDTLLLKDGDTLRGTLVEVREGVVTFRAEIAGKVLVPADEVTGFKLSDPVNVEFADGRVIEGRISAPGEKLQLMPAGGAEPVPLDLAAVTIQRGQASTPDLRPPSPAAGISAETGAMYFAGADDFFAPYIRLDFNRAYYDAGPRWSALLADDGSGDFPRVAALRLDWILAADERYQPRIVAGFDRATGNALDVGGEIGLLAGRTFLDDTARADIGILGRIERYDRRLLDHDSFHQFVEDVFYDRDDTRSDEQIDLALAFSRDWAVWHKSRLFSELWLTPSITEPGELRLRGESAYTHPLNEKLDLRINLRVDYNSDPEFTEIDRWRGSLGAGIRWNF